MSHFENWALTYVVNALWQIPLIFAGAWLAAMAASRLGARAEHRIWVCALLVQTVLPGCPISLARLWSALTSLLEWGKAANGETRVFLSPAAASGVGGLHLPLPVADILLIACFGATLYLAIRMVWGLATTLRIARQATTLQLEGELAACWARVRATFCTVSGNPGFTPLIATSNKISGPVTVGSRRLLIPPGFIRRMPAAEFDALLAHEFAHMARRDFAKNLAYGLVSLPAAWHPAVALTRSRLAESRERVCDAMAGDALASRGRYARSLLRLASMLATAAPAGAVHALGIFDSDNLERRIMGLTGRRLEIRGVRRMLVLAACAVMGVTACASALALRMDVNQPTQDAKNSPKHVDVKNLKIVTKVPPAYPPQAKADRLTGDVVLDVIVGKGGSVENIKVAKSLRDDCDGAAIDAVRQWKFEPVLLNGEPIEVKTTINIVYRLQK